MPAFTNVNFFSYSDLLLIFILEFRLFYKFNYKEYQESIKFVNNKELQIKKSRCSNQLHFDYYIYIKQKKG